MNIVKKEACMIIEIDSKKAPEVHDRVYQWSELLFIQSSMPDDLNHIIGSIVYREPYTGKHRVNLGTGEFSFINRCNMIQIRVLHVYKLNTPIHKQRPFFYDSTLVGIYEIDRENILRSFPWSALLESLPWVNGDFYTEMQMVNDMYGWMIENKEPRGSLYHKLKMWTRKVCSVLNYIVAFDFSTYTESLGAGTYFYPEQSNGADCKGYSSYMMRSFNVCKKLCLIYDIEGWKEVFSDKAQVYYHGLMIRSYSNKTQIYEHINILYKQNDKKYMLDPTNREVYVYDPWNKEASRYIVKPLYCRSIEDGIQGFTDDWKCKRVSMRER